MTYDHKIIENYADALYAQAKWIVFKSVFLAGSTLFSVGIPYGISHALTGCFFGCVLGWVFGSSKAFMLRLQAQTALCQVQIEINTKSIERSIRNSEKMIEIVSRKYLAAQRNKQSKPQSPVTNNSDI